jgi:hypothetical protein
MTFRNNGDDPTARRRRAPDEVLLAAQDVIRRHSQGESVRSIARALGLARTSVARIVAEYDAAQEALDSGDLNAEYAALVSKYQAGFDAEEFDVADADSELVARLVAGGVDMEAEETLQVLWALTADPGNSLATYRIPHLPRTAEWRAGRDKLGRPLAEAAELNAKIAAGWRYHDFAWHPPAKNPSAEKAVRGG